MTVRSSLAATATLARDPDPVEARRLARKAWHDHGVILLSTEWLTGWADRRQAEILAEKAHGKRKLKGL